MGCLNASLLKHPITMAGLPRRDNDLDCRSPIANRMYQSYGAYLDGVHMTDTGRCPTPGNTNIGEIDRELSTSAVWTPLWCRESSRTGGTCGGLFGPLGDGVPSRSLPSSGADGYS